jgi:putative endonuclease
MASKKNGTLYIGVTNDLIRRVYEHKHDVTQGFTKKYGVHTLVWFDYCDDITFAIQREKQMKVQQRKWKIRLIEEKNPDWKDLYEELVEPGFQPSLE